MSLPTLLLRLVLDGPAPLCGDDELHAVPYLPALSRRRLPIRGEWSKIGALSERSKLSN